MGRIGSAILVAAAVATLAGCDVRGSFALDADDVVDVRVVVTPSAADLAAGWGRGTCSTALAELGVSDALRLDLVPSAAGLTCVVQGRMPLDELGRWTWVAVHHQDGHHVVTLAPGFLQAWPPESMRLELEMPGPVESATAPSRGRGWSGRT